MADFRAGLTAGCERLVSPAVECPARRERQRRLIAVLLAAPFLAAVPLAQGLGAVSGIALAMAATCALFVVAWAIALFVAQSGKGRAGEIAALASGTAVLFAAVLALGGPASPALALALALPVEAYWITRSRTDVRRTAAVAVAVLALAAAVGAPHVATVTAWHWLAPAIYGLLLVLRTSAPAAGEPAARQPLLADEAVERLDVAILRIAPSGEVVAASARSGEIMGIETDLLLGEGLFDRINVADRVAWLCALSDLRDRPGSRPITLRLRVPKGSKEPEAQTFGEFDGQLIATEPGGDLVAVLHDASETALLRRRLAEALDRVEATEIAKGRFLASVSHELRTPLNAIIGFSDMLLHREMSGRMGAKQTEHVGLIREAGRHLLSVVNAILDVSKIEAGSYQIVPEPFMLKQTVELSCSMMQPQASEQGVTLSSRIPYSVGEVTGDQRAVQQILLNLLSNAIKFTPSGGTVRVSARRSGGSLYLRVSDNGIGIEEKDLEKIGKPFVQVQNDYTRRFQGTGLGLSLVQGLVKLHGGSLAIESAPGLGTTVTVCLPQATIEAEAATEGVAIEAARHSEGSHGGTLQKIA